MRGAYDVVGGVPRFTRGGGAVQAGAGAGAGRAAAAADAVREVAVRPPSRCSSSIARRSRFPQRRPKVEIHLRIESFESPSVNVIGVVRGTDPKLRDEYVLFSSHQDHDGVRYAVNGDSIWNGADDNASTSVALLAIARAWVKQPSKRSALFVFHGAEERGLLGSRYHAAHPVVPLTQIVAVLNGDMIGRNNPDTAALHRLAAAAPQLARARADGDRGQQAHRASSSSTRSWDRPTHPEGWYFRSDHVPYAERSVPALFFSTNLHPDYHTPRDEPKNINYPEAHAHDAVDVHDRLDRRQRAGASNDRRRIRAAITAERDAARHMPSWAYQRRNVWNTLTSSTASSAARTSITRTRCTSTIRKPTRRSRRSTFTRPRSQWGTSMRVSRRSPTIE